MSYVVHGQHIPGAQLWAGLFSTQAERDEATRKMAEILRCHEVSIGNYFNGHTDALLGDQAEFMLRVLAHFAASRQWSPIRYSPGQGGPVYHVIEPPPEPPKRWDFLTVFRPRL